MLFTLKPVDEVNTVHEEVLRVLLERGPQTAEDLNVSRPSSPGIWDEKRGINKPRTMRALHDLQDRGVVRLFLDGSETGKSHIWAIVMPHPLVDASRLFDPTASEEEARMKREAEWLEEMKRPPIGL